MYTKKKEKIVMTTVTIQLKGSETNFETHSKRSSWSWRNASFVSLFLIRKKGGLKRTPLFYFYVFSIRSRHHSIEKKDKKHRNNSAKKICHHSLIAIK